MKTFSIIVITAYICVAGCNNTKNAPELTDTISALHSTELAGTLYRFALTDDKNYCSPDSIVGTDCGGGNFYFTKKGNVIYTFYCQGSDTTTFEIGKYTITNGNIQCVFDQDYSYYNGMGDEEQKPYDPNSGKLKTTKRWSVELKKINCKTFEYTFTGNTPEIFVLEKTAQDRMQYFFDDYNKIKALSDL